jgi:gluconolactonase
MNRNKAVRGFNTFRFSLVICGILLALVVTGAIVVAQPPPQILAKDAQWQQVSHAGKVWGEGVVAARDGMLYVSDLTYSGVIKENNPRGTIYRYDPATGATTKYMEPSGMSNGLHVDKHGDLIIAQDADFGGRAVLRRNLATEKTVLLADSYEGTRFNGPNDVTSDAHGRIYFTDARYGGDEPWTGLSNAFYRIDPDGKLTRLAVDIFRPNGIEVSADGKRLYVAACNSTMLPINPNGPAKDKFGFLNGGIAVYDLDKNVHVSNGREFFRADDIGVDGTAMDTDGNLYIAMHNGNPGAPKSDIVVVNPAGVVLQHLPTPAGNGLTTNLAFGRGADSHSLYVTTSFPWGLYRIQTVKKGFYQ